LLANFALTIFDALDDVGTTNLIEPDPDNFDHNGYTAFNHFLRTVKRVIGAEQRIILTIDEFELVEQQITRGQVDAEMLDFLRGIIHSEPWLILALAGLHTLEEMTADYWNPLFASITPIRVSFLTREATAQLLANPNEDFPLDFTHTTIDRVFELVRGQPYLTQLIGHSLVHRYNQSVFEDSRPRDPRFTPEDVNAIVNSPEFYEQGSYYFNGVWGQAEKAGPKNQLPLLRLLAVEDEPISVSRLLEQTGLSETEGRASLETLRQHDVVVLVEGDVYDFAVPLMRRWIREQKV
jgi:hypothetical protein